MRFACKHYRELHLESQSLKGYSRGLDKGGSKERKDSQKEYGGRSQYCFTLSIPSRADDHRGRNRTRMHLIEPSQGSLIHPGRIVYHLQPRRRSTSRTFTRAESGIAFSPASDLCKEIGQ